MNHRTARLATLLVALSACAKGPSQAESSSAASVTQAPSPPPRAPVELTARPEPTSSAAVAPAPASPDPTPTPIGGNVAHQATWTIHFDPNGTSILRNGTGRAYSVLHDSNLQPSRLEVTDASGKAAPVFDRRRTMKFDNTVRKEAFVRVESGGELPLFALQINPRADQLELGWGPYVIGPLPAGRYVGSVIFESREDHYFDETTHAKRKLDDAWVGTVRSDPVPITLGGKPP